MHLLFHCGVWLFCNQATCAVLPWEQIYNSALYSALGLIVELPLLAAGAGRVYLGKYTALCVTVRLLWHRAWKPEYGCESHRATPAVVWMEADKTDETEKHGIWTNTLSPTRSRSGRNCKHYFFIYFSWALFHKIITFIGTDWLLIITVPPNIWKSWARVQMEAWTWDQPSLLPPPAPFCRAGDLPSMCLVPIPHLLSTPESHLFSKTDPGKRPKLALEVGFRPFGHGILETLLLTTH